MTTDFYNLLISDCALAIVLLGLFWYVQRISRDVHGVALWGVAHLVYSFGAALLDGTSQELETAGRLQAAYWIIGRLVMKRTKEGQAAVENHYHTVFSHVSDSISNVSVVHSYNRIEAETKALKSFTEKLLSLKKFQ